jgi:hypothetical protein
VVPRAGEDLFERVGRAHFFYELYYIKQEK